METATESRYFVEQVWDQFTAWCVFDSFTRRVVLRCRTEWSARSACHRMNEQDKRDCAEDEGVAGKAEFVRVTMEMHPAAWAALKMAVKLAGDNRGLIAKAWKAIEQAEVVRSDDTPAPKEA